MENMIKDLENRMRKVSETFNYDEMNKLYDDVTDVNNMYFDLGLDDKNLANRIANLRDKADDLNEIIYLMDDFRKNF